MIEVLFVGDEPSKDNHDPEIAFIGTKSYKVLLEWWKRLGQIGIAVENSHNSKSLKAIRYYYGLDYKVVALGNNASKRLSKMNIQHFKLPHPSPRNRKLNDKEYIDSELAKCYLYIKEQTDV